MNRGLDFLADSDAQRLTSDVSEQSPDVNFWGNIASGMSKVLNYKLSAEIEVIYAGWQPTDQYPTIFMPFTSSMQSVGLSTRPETYGTWKEPDLGIVFYPGCRTVPSSALTMDLPEAWERIKDAGGDKPLGGPNVVHAKEEEAFEPDIWYRFYDAICSLGARVAVSLKKAVKMF